MRLKHIQLLNYRNFKEYEISFGTDTTILIGKNGMGKTNLISAMKHALSFIFAKRKGDIQYDFIASSNQKVKSFASTDARYCNDERYGFDYRYPISICSTVELRDFTGISWEMYQEYRTSGLDETKYALANETFWQHNINRYGDMPVLAFFSDSYPHIKTTIGSSIKKILDAGTELPANTAYYKWDEEKNCTTIWMQYFLMQWKNSVYKNDIEKKCYIDEICKKMVEFSLPMNSDFSTPELELKTMEVEARGSKDVIIMSFANGERIPFSELPQGYKRIFSIVFDILNRSYLLNRNCNPSGIVLIDELELHLHPSIAHEILARLRRSFPKIQFIVSTHSPLVITNFKQDERNVLYRLFKDEEYRNERVNNLYGVDYNSGLRYSMDTPERESEINLLLESYDYWRESGNQEIAEKLKQEIKERLGDNSVLYRNLFE